MHVITSLHIANTLRNRNGNAATADPTPGGVLDLALAARRNRRTPTVTRSRDFLRQAALYSAAFLVCFSGPIVGTFSPIFGRKICLSSRDSSHLYLYNLFLSVQCILITGKLDDVPFGVVLFNGIVRPLQGCLNILIYTRPHVKNARMQDQSLTYFHGLKIVILSGCDDDEKVVGNNRNRRRSRLPRNNLGIHSDGSTRRTAVAKANTPSDRTTQAQGNQQSTGSLLLKALQFSKTPPQSTTYDATTSRPRNLDEEMGDFNCGESLLENSDEKMENSNDGDENSVETEVLAIDGCTCKVAGTDGNSNAKNGYCKIEGVNIRPL